MKPATTLKDLLKPPFSIYPLGEIVDASFDHYVLMSVHGRTAEGLWGLFSKYENGDRLYEEFKEFVVSALNEKWEREYGEPLRWWKRDGYWKCRCPKCLKDAMDFYDYCPSCGQRLLPPEGN
jgi:hypothetical protein